MKLYREVKASERLPEETNYYNTDNGDRLFSVAYFIADDEDFKDTWRENEHLVWLEPIEITEDEVSAKEWVLNHINNNSQYTSLSNELEVAYRAGQKAVTLSLLNKENLDAAGHTEAERVSWNKGYSAAVRQTPRFTLPTEEEIYKIVSSEIIVQDDIFGVSMESAKAILSKLKGE